MKTADRVALDLLLRGDESGLRRLARRLNRQSQGRVECPACGDRGPHADNGDRRDRAFCCQRCGEHFDEPAA